MRKLLLRHGIPVRPGGREPADAKLVETLRELYVGRGLSVEEVGGRVGISAPRVRKLLRGAGVALRPPLRPLARGLPQHYSDHLAELEDS